MTGKGKWILLLALAIATIAVAANSNVKQNKYRMEKEQLISSLRSLDRLSNNFYRDITEYDEHNDKAPDTLLWSHEKSVKEARKILKELLSYRDFLRSQDSKELVRESRVERWGFRLFEERNIYNNIVGILGQLEHFDRSFSQLITDELEIALQHHYYPEALNLITETKAIEKKDYPNYFKRFGTSEEASMLHIYYLEWKYNDEVVPLERKIGRTPEPKIEGKWSALIHTYDSKLSPLLKLLDGTQYEKKANAIARKILGNKSFSLQLKFKDINKGIVEVDVFGLAGTTLELRREDKVVRTYTPGIIREVLQDTLPNVADYDYRLKEVDKADIVTRHYLSYEKIFVSSHTLPNNSTQVKVVDMATGAPVKGVAIKTMSNDLRRTIRTNSTDMQGFATFYHRDKPYWVSVEDSRLVRPHRIYIPRLPQTVEPKEFTSVSYYPDRPMYRRGQELKVGVVAVKTQGNKHEVLPNQSLTIRFMANKNAEEVILKEEKCRTDKQGVVELAFNIPDDQDLNDFRLESSFGDQYITVEDYQRSYLEVTIDSIPKGYVFDNPLVVYGKTTDLNGLPTPAKVQMTYGDDERIEVATSEDGTFVISTPVIKEDGDDLEFMAVDAIGNTATKGLYIPTDSTDMPLSADLVLQGDVINKLGFKLRTTTQPYNSRYLGSLEGRHLFAELVSGKETIKLGEIPVNGEEECSLPNLPSGRYALRIYTIDGYGKEVSEVSDEDYYFYAPDDTELRSDDVLFATQIPEEPCVLFGSNNDLTISLSILEDGNVIHHEYINSQTGKLQRYLVPSNSKMSVSISTVKEGVPYGKTIQIRLSKDEENQQKAHVDGLEFKQPLVPSSQLKRSLTIYGRGGKALANAPVIVTVFDKAVADAAGNSDFWPLLSNSDRYEFHEFMYLKSRGAGRLYGESLRLMAANEEVLVEDVVEIETSAMSKQAQVAGVVPQAPLRTNFVETAYFSALLVTDDKGQVDLSFKLPDTQTKYVAKLYSFTPDLKEECQKEVTFEVYSPLSIELSTPRFLTKGDILEGEAMIRNNGDTPLTATYHITNDSTLLASGEVTVAPHGTTNCPFTIEVPFTDELRLQANVASNALKDGVERVIPLQSYTSTYLIAQPISLYHQQDIELSLPKVDLATTPLLVQLYLDPIQLLLSKLAIANRDEKPSDFSLFGSLNYYYVYKQLQTYLRTYPDFASYLKRVAPELQRIDEPKATYIDRMADPKTLAAFYSYVTNDARLSAQLKAIEKSIEACIVPSGGFRYSQDFYGASPWLTHYILSTLSGLEVENKQITRHFDRSLDFLWKELNDERSYYKDVLGFAILAADYGYKLPPMPKNLKERLDKALADYQTADTHTLLRLARYAKVYEPKAKYEEILTFIRDRSGYTVNDDEKLTLMIFLAEQKDEVTEDVVKFALQTKQNTIWYHSGIMDVSKLILHHITPTTLSDKSVIRMNGHAYPLTPAEQITGAVTRECPIGTQTLRITCQGVKSDYIFGGVSYVVTQPSAEVTPTGDKLKVTKEIYTRSVTAGGEQTFVLAHRVKKGDKLIVRYRIETLQDLSLVTVQDPRPATSQFGYDFRGYHVTDRLWWHYSRRDTHDRIYIDYLPRGRHIIEMEAVATNSGTFTYGPAVIQSYYAPEYAGNSGGGILAVDR